MRAGSLKHRVTIERAAEVQDQSGDPVSTWPTLATVPASIEPLRGSEFYRAGATMSELDTRITVRWMPVLDDLSDKDRISYKNIVYNIVSVAHVELGHREIEILAKSGVNLG